MSAYYGGKDKTCTCRSTRAKRRYAVTSLQSVSTSGRCPPPSENPAASACACGARYAAGWSCRRPRDVTSPQRPRLRRWRSG